MLALLLNLHQYKCKVLLHILTELKQIFKFHWSLFNGHLTLYITTNILHIIFQSLLCNPNNITPPELSALWYWRKRKIPHVTFHVCILIWNKIGKVSISDNHTIRSLFVPTRKICGDPELALRASSNHCGQCESDIRLERSNTTTITVTDMHNVTSIHKQNISCIYNSICHY